MLIPYMLACGATFVSVFLKGIQYKNVNHNLYVHTFITSYFMAMLDVVIIGLIAKNDWSIAFASGTGAAFGMILAMFLHNKFIGDKNEVEERKTKKREDAKEGTTGIPSNK